MLHGVLPLLGALVAIGFSDLMHYICSAGMRLEFLIVTVASSWTQRKQQFRSRFFKYIVFYQYAK